MAKPGQPKLDPQLATPEIQKMTFPQHGGHLSIRNVGVNTLWISWDSKNWFDIASGTSFDEDCEVADVFYCTQLGRTSFVHNWVPWH